MIEEKHIKVGQKFKGNINNTILEITKIYRPNSKYIKEDYVQVKNLTKKNKEKEFVETNITNFRHLLLTPIV